MLKKLSDYLVILLFSVSILLPLTFSDFRGGKISETENRALAKFPDIFPNDPKLLRRIPGGLNNWIQDNIGFRNFAIRLKVTAEINVFHSLTNPQVFLGKNDWLFFKGDNNLEIVLEDYSPSPAQLEDIKGHQIEIQQNLRKKGVEYVIVFIPSKVSVYPELINSRFSVGNTMIDVVADYLAKNTTIPIINLKPALLQAKETRSVFYRTDTHWNATGAYTGYKAIINHLNSMDIIHSGPVSVMESSTFHTGDLSSMAGGIFPPENCISTQIINPKSIKIESGKFYDNLLNLLQANGDRDLSYYQNLEVEKKKLLIFGDSFFGNSNIPQMLAENFSSLDFVHSYNLTSNIVEFVQPDLVIFEMTERYIPILEDYPNGNSYIQSTQNP